MRRGQTGRFVNPDNSRDCRPARAETRIEPRHRGRADSRRTRRGPPRRANLYILEHKSPRPLTRSTHGIPAVKSRAGLILELVVNLLLPWVAYRWAHPHFGETGALYASAIPPVIW